MQAGEDDTAYDNERHNHGLPAICLGSNIEQGPPVIVFDGWLFFHQGAFLKLSHALPAASRAIPGCRWEYVSCRLKESGTFTANTLYGRTFFPGYPFMTFKPAEGKENQAPNRCRKEETVWRADKRTRQGNGSMGNCFRFSESCCTPFCDVLESSDEQVVFVFSVHVVRCSAFAFAGR